MKMAGLVLASALVAATPNGAKAEWDFFGDVWPICDDPDAVQPAGKAFTEKDMDEIERLGCVTTIPRDAWTVVLRCDANARLYYGEHLDHEIEWDDTLPEFVCEIQAWLPDVWIKLFYTHYMNIK